MTSNQHKKDYSAFFMALLILVVMWLVYLFNYTNEFFLNEYSIYPRKLEGLIGVFTSPWLHSSADWSHILNNSAPIFVLSWALFYFYKKIAWQTFLFVWLVGGFLVWVSARQAYHLGMSGVIYGLAAFLFTNGVIRKDNKLLAIALLVVLEYGSMVWGIFPLEERVSWEAHLWGAVTGVVFAFYSKNIAVGQAKKKYLWQIEEELGLDNYEEEFWMVDENGNPINREEEPRHKNFITSIKYIVTKKRKF